jgi:hypothetical protein
MNCRIARTRWFAYLLLSVGVCLTEMAAAQQGELRSTWECLPDETAIALRIPSGSAVADAMVRQTKLGAVLFSETRREKLRQVIVEANAGGGKDFEAMLQEYGMTPDDLPKFFGGESGYAVLISQPEGQSPLAVGVAWVSPGADLAARAYEAIGRLVEQHEDDEDPPQRIDLQLADHDVMQIALPIVSLELGEFKLPDNYENLSEEEQERAWDQAYKQAEASAVKSVTFQTLLAASLGERLLVAHTLGAASDEDRPAMAERLEEIFARLIASHRGEAGEFLPRVLSTRGMAPVLDPEGVTLLEVFGDPAPLLTLARAQAGFQTDENSEKVMSMLGADGLGPFGMRMVMSGATLDTRVFLSVPEPRRGLLRLLEQPAEPSEVPAWAPASAVSFSQFSFDLGDAYRIIKEEVARQFPNEAGQSFAMVEAQVQNFAQASLEEVLDSIGPRHIVISFEPEMVKPVETAELDVAMPQDRMAFVWEVTNDEVWGRLLKSIGGFAALMPGLKSTDEQGFNGWRLQSEPMEGGLVSGKGYLVLAIGQGALETTLSSLNNPPRGRDALRESELVARASALMELRPSVAFDVTDADRYARAGRAMLASIFDQMELYSQEFDDESEETDLAWIKVARELLPDDDEMENMFGADVSVMEVDQNGVLIRSVNELPPPE